MKQFFQSHDSKDELIVFFAGWGCDHNQFADMKDKKDVLILYDYQDLQIDFDFSRYKHIDLIAYSAGVFVASVLQNQIPNLRKKVAICGNPYLFDERLGLSADTVELFYGITLDNYLEFRRKYLVETQEEYEKFNALESIRTIESCRSELSNLQKLYDKYKEILNPNFDKAFAAENDLFFDLKSQQKFFGETLQIIPHAKHHVFFAFSGFEDILNQ